MGEKLMDLNAELQNFRNYLDQEQLTETTKCLYIQIIKQMFEEFYKENIEFNEENVRKWVVKKAAYNYRAAVVKYLKFKKLTWDIPRIRQRPKKSKRNVERERLKKIIEKLKGTHLYYIYKILYETGARISEVLELKLEDLLFDEGYIDFRKTKTGYPRLVKVKRSLLEELKALYLYKLGYLTKDKLFYRRTKNRKIAYVMLYQDIDRMVKKGIITKEDAAFLKKTHNFRRALINEALLKTHNILGVKKFVGHKRLSSTEQYLHEATEEKEKEEIEKALGIE